MHLTIARVTEMLYDGEAYSATVPGASGEMTILADHMPLISTLKAGTIRVRATRDAKEQEFEIKKGVIEVTPERTTVIL